MELTDKFTKEEIEWRIQTTGKSPQNGNPWAMVLPYITSRAIMNRLDEVVGIYNWKDHYVQLKNGLMCTIFIKTKIITENTLKTGEALGTTIEHEWIGKSDGAPETERESFKGGMSDAFKRAAVKWGMGRYLYTFKGPFFVDLLPQKVGEHNAVIQDKKNNTKEYYSWDPPIIEGIYHTPNLPES